MAATAATFDVADLTTPGPYGPARTALLLLDFHAMFVHRAGGPHALAALNVAAEMRKWAVSQGIPVIHCLIDLDATPFPTCKNADLFASTVVAMRSEGGNEPDDLRDHDGGGNVDEHTFVRRPGYVSALKSPGFNEFLRQRGIRSLVLCGLSTSGCVLRTAITACDEEYVVTVLSDGCADREEGVHDMVTERLLTNRGYVVTAAEFRKAFAEAHG